MKKTITLISLLTLTAFAQDPVATPVITSILPTEWSGNAMIVLVVNFVLAMLALLVKKVPGGIGQILSSIIDMFSANVKHSDKK